MPSHINENQAKYATYNTWCLSQARINWEGSNRKGTWHNNGGDDGGEGTISPDGVESSRTAGDWSPAGLLVNLPMLSSPPP